jgi:hypothetical protein
MITTVFSLSNCTYKIDIGGDPRLGFDIREEADCGPACRCLVLTVGCVIGKEKIERKNASQGIL